MRHIRVPQPNSTDFTFNRSHSPALAAVMAAFEVACRKHQTSFQNRTNLETTIWKGRLANNFIELGLSDPYSFAASLSAKLRQPETGRWEVDDAVLRQAELLQLEDKRFWAHFARNVKLPHNPLWLEFRPVDGIFSSSRGYERVGCLITQEAGSELTVQFCAREDGEILQSTHLFRIGSSGISVSAEADPVLERHLPLIHAYEEMAGGDYAQMVHDVIRLIVVMTAHRTPVSVGEPEDLAKLNRQRQKSGHCPRWALQPVRWDVSHRPDGARARDHADDAGEPAYHKRRHYQRGHFKARNGHIFWVSGHFHGRGEDMSADGRDHKVSARRHCAPKKQ